MAVETGWHMDKKVTLALIFALLVNAGGTIWWASRLDATVLNHEQRIEGIIQNVASLSAQQNGTNEKLARIEEAQKYGLDMLKDVRESLKDKKR